MSEIEHYMKSLSKCAHERDSLQDERNAIGGELVACREGYDGLREELAQLHKQWAEESSAADACEERLRKSEFDANAKAAMLKAKAERLREALERIADAHPDSNDARWAGKIARAALAESDPERGERHMISGEDGQDHDPPESKHYRTRNDAGSPNHSQPVSKRQSVDGEPLDLDNDQPVSNEEEA